MLSCAQCRVYAWLWQHLAIDLNKLAMISELPDKYRKSRIENDIIKLPQIQRLSTKRCPALLYCLKHWLILAIGVSFFILLIVITCITVINIRRRESISTERWADPVITNRISTAITSTSFDSFRVKGTETTFTRSATDVTIYPKNFWHGKEHRESISKALVHPIDLVVIAHTAGTFCTDVNCSASNVRNIQRVHMRDPRQPDIGYNFLIGADGGVYEGRGWLKKNWLPLNNSLEISFLGNYNNNKITDLEVRALIVLLQEGVDCGYLTQNYSLIAHNQVMSTQSPGKNILTVMKTWSHYSDEFYY